MGAGWAPWQRLSPSAGCFQFREEPRKVCPTLSGRHEKALETFALNSTVKSDGTEPESFSLPSPSLSHTGSLLLHTPSPSLNSSLPSLSHFLSLSSLSLLHSLFSTHSPFLHSLHSLPSSLPLPSSSHLLSSYLGRGRSWPWWGTWATCEAPGASAVEAPPRTGQVKGGGAPPSLFIFSLFCLNSFSSLFCVFFFLFFLSSLSLGLSWTSLFAALGGLAGPEAAALDDATPRLSSTFCVPCVCLVCALCVPCAFALGSAGGWAAKPLNLKLLKDRSQCRWHGFGLSSPCCRRKGWDFLSSSE